MGLGEEVIADAGGTILRAPRLVRHVQGTHHAYAIHMADLDARGEVLGYGVEPVSTLFASAGEMRRYLEWLLLTGLDCVGCGEAAYPLGRDGIRSWLAALDAPPLERDSAGGC